MREIFRVAGALIMGIVGFVMLLALDEFIVGNIWLVGAILLIWMPEGK